MTIEEVAKYLNYAEKTIRKWVLKREIPFIRINQSIRFQVSEIDKWVELNKVRPLSMDKKDINKNLIFKDGNLFETVNSENETAEAK